MTLRKILVRVALVLVSTGGALLLAELIIRTVAPEDMGLRAPWYESHPVYRYRHYPNIDEARRWGVAYRLRTNSRGLRADEDFPYDAPARFRIAVLGDSMTLGVGVDNAQTFVQRVQTALRSGDRPVDVLNFGVSAYGPDQQLLLFREEARRYSPAVYVIVVCLGNDLDDLTRPDTSLRLQHGALVPVPYRPSLMKQLSENLVYRWVAGRSHLLIAARRVLVDDRVQADAEAARAAQPPPLPLAMAIYRAFAEEIRRDGATPVVLLLPTPDQVSAAAVHGDQKGTGAPDVLRASLLSWCGQADVVCVDALDAMASRANAAGALFIRGDDHLNPEGHAVVARLMEPVLAAHVPRTGTP